MRRGGICRAWGTRAIKASIWALAKWHTCSPGPCLILSVLAPKKSCCHV